MTSTSARFLGPALLLAAALAQGVVGCTQQSEGERCSLLNGNADCTLGLTCTAAGALRSGDTVDRCCPPPGDETDDRCTARTGSVGTGGEGGEGGDTSVGSGGDTSVSSGGATAGLNDKCRYDSECPLELVCGATGLCQYPCLEDRDCTSADQPFCSAEKQCVASADDSSSP